MNNKLIELLAPAGTAAIGRAAIDAGADAVYIGAEQFSARAAAGNSIEQIASLCQYGHQFGAKIYLALNTLLADNEELQAARQVATAAIEAGIDAIIFQDRRLLDMGLPIPMHASTQTFNDGVERVAELQKAGCSRVVLERALSIDEIRAITSATDVEIEAFIHGAICVGYSGICNLSEHLTGRSGNRGQCAQPCRSRYDLLDADNQMIIANEPLLSPRDLNLSRRIGELIEAGVCSLKIEGRLKEVDYVQNVVAHYDTILKTLGVNRSSNGVVRHNFTPDLRLTFNRGFTEWFFDGASNTERRAAASAPPSGEPIGKVREVAPRSVIIERRAGVTIANGDGLCFNRIDTTATGDRLGGVRVNRADGDCLHLLSTEGIEVGMTLYRNSSVAFRPSSSRQIELDIVIDNQSITATDDYGHTATITLAVSSEMASNVERAVEMLRSGMSKTGGTIFSVRTVDITCDQLPFLSSAMINALRRELLDRMAIECAKRILVTPNKTSSEGLSTPAADHLLRSRYCILREYSMCLKTNKLKLPLSLKNNNRTIKLHFDCKKCEMSLLEDKV